MELLHNIRYMDTHVCIICTDTLLCEMKYNIARSQKRALLPFLPHLTITLLTALDTQFIYLRKSSLLSLLTFNFMCCLVQSSALSFGQPNPCFEYFSLWYIQTTIPLHILLCSMVDVTTSSMLDVFKGHDISEKIKTRLATV